MNNKFTNDVVTIFSYGSLMDDKDLRRTVPDATNITPCIVYGYKRVFDFTSTYRFTRTKKPVCVLNLKKVADTYALNGICFDMDKSSFDELLEREDTYDLVKVKSYYYENQLKYKDAYFFITSNYPKYKYLLDSETQDDYLHICLRGASQYGKDFLQDFKETTEFYGIEESDYSDKVWKNL